MAVSVGAEMNAVDPTALYKHRRDGRIRIECRHSNYVVCWQLCSTYPTLSERGQARAERPSSAFVLHVVGASGQLEVGPASATSE